MKKYVTRWAKTRRNESMSLRRRGYLAESRYVDKNIAKKKETGSENFMKKPEMKFDIFVGGKPVGYVMARNPYSALYVAGYEHDELNWKVDDAIKKMGVVNAKGQYGITFAIDMSKGVIAIKRPGNRL